MTSKYISNRAQRAFSSLIQAEEDYDDGADYSDLPEVFHKVAQALPAAQESLQAVHLYLSTNEWEAEQEDQDEQKKAVSKVQACAQSLAHIFQEVIHASDGEREATYQEQAGDDKQVEVLMKDILEAILVFAKPPAVTDEQLEALKGSLSAITKIQPAPTVKTGAGIHYHGSGTQAIHQGKGNQNINAGKGNQFNGTFGQLPFPTS